MPSAPSGRRALRHTKRELNRLLLARFTSWKPSVVCLIVVLLILALNTISYYLGHSTIINDQGQKLNFRLPPISLTANHFPEYVLNAVSCAILSLYALRYIHAFAAVYRDYTELLVSPERFGIATGHRPSEAVSEEDVDTSSPGRHHDNRIAFWHDHFHQAGLGRRARRERNRAAASSRASSASSDIAISNREADDGVRLSSDDPGPSTSSLSLETDTTSRSLADSQRIDISRLKRGGLSQRPCLLIVTTMLCLAIGGFLLEALVPAQRDTLYEIGRGCVEVDAPEAPPSSLRAEELRSEFLADIQGEGVADHIDVEYPQAGRRLQSELATTILNRLRAWDPSRPPMTGTPLRADRASRFSLEKHIECEDLGHLEPTNATLVHAFGALTFFLLSSATMLLFTLWLLWRRLAELFRGGRMRQSLFQASFVSIVIKGVFLTLPWVRPLESVKDDLLDYLSLVEWNGLVQRFAVLCILCFIASLGLEIRDLRKSIKSIQ